MIGSASSRIGLFIGVISGAPTVRETRFPAY